MKFNHKKYGGTDVGGSHIAFGVVDAESGQMVESSYRKIPISPRIGSSEFIGQLEILIKSSYALN